MDSVFNDSLNVKTTRRQLLKVSTTAVGGLTLGMSLTGCGTAGINEMDAAGNWTANAWLQISEDGKVVFTLDRVEMGQGTYTGLTTLLAEELDVEPETVEVVFAPAETVYRNPDYGLQLTGGSNSLSSSWEQIREAGAAAREMILAAAADVFKVPATALSTDEGRVISSNGQQMPYGELISLAAKQRVPSSPKLKQASEFKYIGKQNKRLDGHLKVTGQAGYGIDVVVDGMRYAVVKRSPYIGGTVRSHNGADIEGMAGVEKIVEIETGMAIVADSYWRARKAEQALTVEWQKPENMLTDTAEVFNLYKKLAQEDDGDSKRSEGDIDEALEKADQLIESEFEAPFLAHATMEPMNCVAHVVDGHADIWTATQAPDIARVTVAKVTDLSLDEVHIHNQFLGGGFGRRLTQDFVGEAAEISYKAGGPIKLVWSREDDTQHDFYRPATYHKMRAAIDSDGQVTGWDHQIVAPKIMEWYIWDAAPAMFPWSPKFMYKMLGHSGLMTEGTPVTPPDTSPYEGAEDLPYLIPAIEVRHTKADAGVPITYWRSVGHSQNAFVVESFVDELAHKAGQDEYQFRRRLLAKDSRLLKVLDIAAEKGQWGKNTDEGVFQGISAHKSFDSYVAQVIELKIEYGEIKVQKVVCAVDCGLVVNPDIVTMQMESGVIFGITAALFGEITIADGQIQQSNFHDYRILRMNESPVIETHIVESEESPTGVGEPGLPPVAPAMAGALFKATGKRYRKLPFRVAQSRS